jgi:hypothetical protein
MAGRRRRQESMRQLRYDGSLEYKYYDIDNEICTNISMFTTPLGEQNVYNIITAEHPLHCAAYSTIHPHPLQELLLFALEVHEFVRLYF